MHAERQSLLPFGLGFEGFPPSESSFSLGFIGLPPALSPASLSPALRTAFAFLPSFFLPASFWPTPTCAPDKSCQMNQTHLRQLGLLQHLHHHPHNPPQDRLGFNIDNTPAFQEPKNSFSFFLFWEVQNLSDTENLYVSFCGVVKRAEGKASSGRSSQRVLRDHFFFVRLWLFIDINK